MELTVEKIKKLDRVVDHRVHLSFMHENETISTVDIIDYLITELDKRTPSPSADKLIAETAEKCAEIAHDNFDATGGQVVEAIRAHFNLRE